MMHGMPLNIAKILFKYSFLDAMTEPKEREELAEYLLSIDCPFDCRLESLSGWMRASAMQAFECGSTKSPGLGPNIMKLCDMAYGVEAMTARQAAEQPGSPQEDPADEPEQDEPPQPSARAQAKDVRRPTKKPSRKPAAAARPQAPAPAAAARPPAAEPAARLRPTDADDATWKMLEGRYGEHAHTVHEIMRSWELYHELSELLADIL